jgi:hypothetical protein
MDVRDIKFLRAIKYRKKKIEWAKANEICEREADERIKSGDFSQYARLQEFKDKYKGKRCFIVATGPSLLIEDLEKLNGEYCFGMNSICKLYDRTTWRPDFYGIQDIMVYDAMKEALEATAAELNNVFVSELLAEKRNLPAEYIVYPFNSYYHDYDAEIQRFHAKFSDNALRMVYDGYSITYSLLQIAIFMGFTEIYLIGVDCNYEKGKKNHIVESGHVDRRAYQAHKKMTTAFKVAAEFAAAHPQIQIINCTRGGKLEVFPRKSLEDVLRK